LYVKKSYVLARAVARSGRSRVARGCKPLDGARGALASSPLPAAEGGNKGLCNSPDVLATDIVIEVEGITGKEGEISIALVKSNSLITAKYLWYPY